MSRCFPFPPPGYELTPALIELIKLQSEIRERRTRSKKEKSKHKKHISKEHKEKSSHHSLSDQKQKEVKTNLETEQLEKSSLTEERGHPAWPQSPGYLSDVSQINHKRKRVSSLQPNEDCKPEKTNRNKLASSPSQHVISLEISSTSGRDNSLDQKRVENRYGGPIDQKPSLAIAETAVAIKNSVSKQKFKSPTSNAVKNIGRAQQQNDVSVRASARHPTRHRTRHPDESIYESLIMNWVPLPIQLLPMDDQEWLFVTRKQKEHAATTNTASNTVPSCRNFNLWPRGQYLADADVYSLPYSIPY